MSFVLVSPGDLSARTWKVLEFARHGGCSDADADTRICASTHLYSVNNCKKC